MPGVVYLWEEIDQKFDQFGAMAADDPRKNLLGAEMRGMCNALSYFMRPYYPTGDDVIREIRERGKARAAGEHRHTAGIGNVVTYPPGEEDRFVSSMDQTVKDHEDGLHKHPARAASTPRSKAPVTHNFSDAEVEKIKMFAQNGFSEADLANVHGVSVAVIKAALSS